MLTVKKMPVTTISDDEFIAKINQLGFCQYDPKQKAILVDSDLPQSELIGRQSLKKLVDFLTFNRPTGKIMHYPKAIDMQLSFYSGCLLNYVFEILAENKNHEDTCWYKNCENSRLIGYVGESNNFVLESELAKSAMKDTDLLLKNFTKLNKEDFFTSNGWLKYNSPLINKHILTFPEKVKSKLKLIYRGNYDRSIPLIKSICDQGFNEYQAYGVKNGVLGFSSLSNDYAVMHGKHRVVSMIYLSKIGFLPQDTEVMFPTIKYPFHHFGNSIGQRCGSCGKNS